MTMPRPLIFLLIVAACGALDIALHMAGGDLIPMPSAFSPLVDRFGFGAVVTVWIAQAFTGMGLAQEVLAIVAPDGLWTERSSISLAELAATSLIFRSRGSSTQEMVDRAFRRAGLSPEPRLTADTRDAVYEAVALGIGTGFMWRNGTYRTDTVRKLAVPEFSAATEEVAFALADERNEIVDLFLAEAARFAQTEAMRR